jgi:hypothetical protein
MACHGSTRLGGAGREALCRGKKFSSDGGRGRTVSNHYGVLTIKEKIRT